MRKLIEYIDAHTDRGECQCGSCCDKGEDRKAPPHSVNVHFFWVSKYGEPTAEALRAVLESDYPDLDRLAGGPSYIELGGAIGSQGHALLLIGLGELVGLWKVITPRRLGITDPEVANNLAGGGYVMCTGMRSSKVTASVGEAEKGG